MRVASGGMCGVCAAAKDTFPASKNYRRSEWTEMRTANRAAMRYLQCGARSMEEKQGTTSDSGKSLVAVPLLFVLALLCARRNRKAVTRPTDLLKVHPPFLYINWSSESGSQTHPSQSPRRPAISAIAKETKSHHQRVIFKTGTARQYEVRVALDRSNINLAANALTEDGEHW